MARLHSCNVLRSTGTNRQLWQFQAQGNFPLVREQQVGAGEALADSLAQKSWGQLWQARLNVALLPPEHVFFRVVNLPPSNFTETLAMVELQLEKLSPIPVGQIVWSLYVLPPAPNAPATDLQTLIVVFAERKIVEEFLGELEGAGYLADRIELEALDQISAVKIDANGAWIYPGLGGGPDTALVAWWYDGKLQSLNALSLAGASDRAEAAKEQISQMAWAGELEGWLTALPVWTLVGNDETVAQWETQLRTGLDAPIRLVKPVPAAELAALTAKRATASDSKSNLIPPEVATLSQSVF